MPRDSVDQVEWLRRRLRALDGEVPELVLKQVESYRLEALVSPSALRQEIDGLLAMVMAALTDPGGTPVLAPVRETATERATDGVPLADLLQAQRIVFTAVREVLEDGPPGDRNTRWDTRLWRIADESAVVAATAYRAEVAARAARDLRRRDALLDALFEGTAAHEMTAWEISKALGLPQRGELVVVVAETTEDGTPGLPDLDAVLVKMSVATVWRDTPRARFGVVALRDGVLDRFAAIVREHARARVGISPPYQDIVRTPRARRLACAALHQLPEHLAAVATLSPAPLAGLLAQSTEEGRRIALDVLGPVLDLSADERATLLGTLRAWFDHDGSAERAAQPLFCHPNTVRNRLRRLQELTGRTLSNPRDVADLAVALEAVRHYRTPGWVAGGPVRRTTHDPALTARPPTT